MSSDTTSQALGRSHPTTRSAQELANPARSTCAAGVDQSLVPVPADDLSREVYCILGIPIDAVEMPAVLGCIEEAANTARPFVISTPNLNFLVNSLDDSEFRELLLLSDLCTADGVPIVWIARLLGIPIRRRVAGSDMFALLKARPVDQKPLKVFFFGATESVAAAAARSLNSAQSKLQCVGWICPGFGTVEEMSSDETIDSINSSGADFLVVALGAKKGQLWLVRNHQRLRIPIRSHLGAVLNFQAGTVSRAPQLIQKCGLEWAWRIKEEPYLWRRYWHDGHILLQLMLTRVLPLGIFARLLQRKCNRERHNLVIDLVQSSDTVTAAVSGFAIACNVEQAVPHFRDAVNTGKRIVLDFSKTVAIDARFLGLLLMLRNQLKGRGVELEIAGLSRSLNRIFRLNGLEYLLPTGASS